jgi:hypothetical protein
MARSVSTPTGAVATVYLNRPHIAAGEGEPDDSYFAEEGWEDFLLDLRQVLDGSAGAPGGKGFPSLSECDRWLDREDHAILENCHAVVTVSEYCGLVAVCLVPKDANAYSDPSPLALEWCARVEDSFEKLLHGAYKDSALRSQGRASNGEQFFALVGEQGSCVTSKEGRLW